MLKNRSSSYSSHYIIKIVGFMPILYAINLCTVSSSIVLTICILDLFIYSMLESILLFVISKKKKVENIINTLICNPISVIVKFLATVPVDVGTLLNHAKSVYCVLVFFSDSCHHCCLIHSTKVA